MAFRSDITIDWTRSPRIITVLAPSTSLTIQDLYDTLRQNEDDVYNTPYDEIVSAGGKEDLEGGAFVAVTLSLLNALLRFEARLTETSSGTITSADTTGMTLTDAAADFITDGVTVGAMVYNTTDGSLGNVVSIDPGGTELTLDARLTGGTDDQFDFGDSYRIWNNIACVVSGGNLTAKDALGASTFPILASANTTVTISQAAATAALNQDEFIAATALEIENAVYFDAVNGTAGTASDNGIQSNPSNNVADTLTMAVARGKSTVLLRQGTFTLDRNVDSLRFQGEITHENATVDPNGFTVTNCSFWNLNLTGDFGGSDVEVRECELDGITNIQGHLYNSGLESNLTTAVGGSLAMIECFSLVAGSSTPYIDMLAGSTGNLQLRAWTGGIELRNIDQVAQNCSVDLLAGHLVLAATCTAGTLVLRGAGKFTDNSAGITIDQRGFVGLSSDTDATIKSLEDAIDIIRALSALIPAAV